MLQGLALFFVGIGALLVSIVSMLHLAWLAVMLPLAIAIAAAFGIYSLGRRRRRAALPDRHERDRRPKSPRIAA
jgi:membrane protein implicated in regulation of membrane protease activity